MGRHRRPNACRCHEGGLHCSEAIIQLEAIATRVALRADLARLPARRPRWPCRTHSSLRLVATVGGVAHQLRKRILKTRDAARERLHRFGVQLLGLLLGGVERRRQ